MGQGIQGIQGKQSKHDKDYYYYGTNAMSNAIRTLFANIQFSAVDNPVRQIVITSAIPNEGKTTIATNLAKVIATSGYKTLLIEGDMRKRGCAEALGISCANGIYAVLSEKKPLAQVVATIQDNLDFLDAESGIPNPDSVFNSAAFEKLQKQVGEEYDYVIYDTPPVGTFVDAAILARTADATILAMRQEYVTRDEVVAAYEQLVSAGANIIGTCSTFERQSKREYYHHYYYYDDGTRSTSHGKSFEALDPKSAIKRHKHHHSHGEVDDAEAADGAGEQAAAAETTAEVVAAAVATATAATAETAAKVATLPEIHVTSKEEKREPAQGREYLEDAEAAVVTREQAAESEELEKFEELAYSVEVEELQKTDVLEEADVLFAKVTKATAEAVEPAASAADPEDDLKARQAQQAQQMRKVQQAMEQAAQLQYQMDLLEAQQDAAEQTAEESGSQQETLHRAAQQATQQAASEASQVAQQETPLVGKHAAAQHAAQQQVTQQAPQATQPATQEAQQQTAKEGRRAFDNNDEDDYGIAGGGPASSNS